MTQSSSHVAAETTSNAVKYYTLAILTIVYAFNFIDRQILVVLQPLIKAELDLNDTQLGLLSGFSFAIFYTVLGIPIARLADRSNRKNIIAAALAIWSGMTAVCGLAQNFVQLLLARVGVGIGEAGCSPPAHSMISDLFDPKRRATALAVYSAGLYLGVLVGYSLGGVLGQSYGWRTTFLIVGLPGVLMAILLWSTVREPARAPQDLAAKSTLSDTVKDLMALKCFPYIAFGCALSAFVSYGTTNFMPSYLVRYHGIELSQIGVMLGVTGGGGGIIGTFLGGYLTDKFGKKDARWYLWLPAITAIISFPFGALAFNSDNTTLVLVGYFLFAVAGTLYLAPAIAVSHRLVSPTKRAMTSAVLFLVLNLIGLGMGPVIVGALSDIIREMTGEESLRLSLTIGSGVVFIKAYLFWRGGTKLTGDLERQAASNDAAPS